MANSYTQIYIQYVFTVKGRENLIKEIFRDELEKVICGIVTNHQSKTYAIYCNPDHTHVLVGLNPAISVSKLIEQIKSGSSKWMNEKKFLPQKFHWQGGYGAFSYSKSQTERVVQYILDQPLHHKKHSFREEYLGFLKKFEIDYELKYLFDWIE